MLIFPRPIDASREKIKKYLYTFKVLLYNVVT